MRRTSWGCRRSVSFRRPLPAICRRSGSETCGPSRWMQSLLAGTRRVGGRPLGAVRAWRDLVDGDIDLGRPGRYQRRAEVVRCQMSQADFESLPGAVGALMGGVRAAIEFEASLIAADDRDLYLRRSAFDQLDSVCGGRPQRPGPSASRRRRRGGGSSLAGSSLHVVPSLWTFLTQPIHGTGSPPRAWLAMADDVAIRLPPLAGRQQESWRAFIELAPTLVTSACWSVDRWPGRPRPSSSEHSSTQASVKCSPAPTASLTATPRGRRDGEHRTFAIPEFKSPLRHQMARGKRPGHCRLRERTKFVEDPCPRFVSGRNRRSDSRPVDDEVLQDVVRRLRDQPNGLEHRGGETGGWRDTARGQQP